MFTAKDALQLVKGDTMRFRLKIYFIQKLLSYKLSPDEGYTVKYNPQLEGVPKATPEAKGYI